MSRILHLLSETSGPASESAAVTGGGSSDARDLYKSIVLRESLPPAYRRDRESGWAKRLACIGESGNNIGGLFGKDNFRGETTIGGLGIGGLYPLSSQAMNSAVGFGSWGFGWLCNEVSGDLQPIFGGVPLTRSTGNAIYGLPGPLSPNTVDTAIGVFAQTPDSTNASFIGTAGTFDVGAADDFAMMAVVKVTSHGGVSGSARFCNKSTGGGNGYDFVTGGVNANKLKFLVQSGGVPTSVVTTDVVPAGEWVIVLAVVDRAAQKIKTSFRTMSGHFSISASASFSSSLANVGVFQGFGVALGGAGIFCAAMFIATGLGAAFGLIGRMDSAMYNFAQSLFHSQDISAIEQARNTMFWDSAQGQHLTRLGSNFGVPRPPQSPFDDELYRSIGQILSWLPKTPLLVTYRLAEAIFGTQADLQASIGVSWKIYEVNPNEFIFECPVLLIAGNPAIASYLHGYPGTLTAVGTTTITFVGTDARLAAVTLVGLTLRAFIGGVWTSFTISSASYVTSTKVNTLVLSGAVTAGNYQFYIDIPEVSSFLGDFMLASASVAGGGLNPPTSQLVYLYGQGRLDIFSFYFDNFVRAAGVILRKEVL